MNHCIDLFLGKAFCIFIFFDFPNSRLSLVKGFDFYFCFLMWVKTENKEMTMRNRHDSTSSVFAGFPLITWQGWMNSLPRESCLVLSFRTALQLLLNVTVNITAGSWSPSTSSRHRSLYSIWDVCITSSLDRSGSFSRDLMVQPNLVTSATGCPGLPSCGAWSDFYSGNLTGS